jgi:hypothetical protein
MTKQTDIVSSYRSQNFAVFEIGKYMIEDNLGILKNKAIRSDIFHWLIDFLEMRGTAELEQSVYFVHVASEVHRRTYQRFFGFDLVAIEHSKNLAEHEHILFIPGKHLLFNLKERLKKLDK